MKQDLINFINALIAAAPDVAEKLMTDEIKSYLTALEKDGGNDKPALTDNGKLVLKYMQDEKDISMFKAKDIAEGLFISSRTVSGAMRKLVTDGFCERIGQDPVIYTLSEKGKTFNID